MLRNTVLLTEDVLVIWAYRTAVEFATVPFAVTPFPGSDPEFVLDDPVNPNVLAFVADAATETHEFP